MTLDPKTMYHIGAQFLIAVHRCIRKETFGDRAAEALDIPAIVNVAFAAEILLKALLSHEKVLPPRGGHHLKKLFGLLSETHKVEIRRRVELEFDRFDERLESVSSTFEEWRYVYEVETLSMPNYRFLQKFTHTVADHAVRILKINPRDVRPLVKSTS